MQTSSGDRRRVQITPAKTAPGKPCGSRVVVGRRRRSKIISFLNAPLCQRRADRGATKRPLLPATSPDEFALADVQAQRATPRIRIIGFLVLLKTFQRLGYFPRLADVPPVIIYHVARLRHTRRILTFLRVTLW